VSTALACAGLGVSGEAHFSWLLKSACTAIREIGTFDGVHVGRWQDDSGATLILGLHDGQIVDFVTAYTGSSGGLLADCRLIYESVAFAKVTDADGQQLTAMVFEAEQYCQLLGLGQQVSGPARITALGTDADIYPDPAAYAASPASQAPGTAAEPPPDYDGPWPPRLAAESLISHAALAGSPQHQSRARLSGTVLNATPHLCALTGQPFTAAAVRTAGFTADLCLAAGDHPDVPEPGNVISGTVVLSAAIDSPLLNAAQA
jgi:hypothetical protein